MKLDTSACSQESEVLSLDYRGNTIMKDQSQTITKTMYKDPLLVLDSAKSTNTQSKPMKKTSQTTLTSETAQKLNQKNFQTLICCVEDFLANHSQSLEKGEVSVIPGGQCFLKLAEYLKLKDLSLYSLKMSKGYSITTKGKLLVSSFKRWKNWGIELNGWFLTANFSEFPRTERGYSLSEVLEENVDQKYYLSESTIKNLVKRVRRGWNLNMMETIKANESIRWKELAQQYPLAKQEEIMFRLLRNRIRRLTEMECERLQGFPNGWTNGQSMTQRYSQMGNAVTVNVIQAIASCFHRKINK